MGQMGCEGTRPTEAVKPIMAPRGFLLPGCLPTTYYLFILYSAPTQPLLPFLRLLLQQLLSALPNSTAPRSTLRLLFLALPPAAGGNHPPSITSIEAANISSLRPNFQPPISYFGRCGACPCRHLLTE